MTKELTSAEIAHQFGIMCCFIEFSPELSSEERGDILYKEFVKRTGLTLTKEELAKICEEAQQQTYYIVDDEATKRLNYVSQDKLEEGLVIASQYAPEQPKEPITVKVKVNDFKHD